MFAPNQTNTNTGLITPKAPATGLLGTVGGVFGGALPQSYAPLAPALTQVLRGLATSPQGLGSSGPLSQVLFGSSAPSLGSTITSALPQMGVNYLFGGSKSPWAATAPIVSHLAGSVINPALNYVGANLVPSLYGAGATAIANASNIVPSIVSNISNLSNWVNPVLGVISYLIGRKNPEAAPMVSAFTSALSPAITSIVSSLSTGVSTAAQTASGVLGAVGSYIPIIGMVLSILTSLWSDWRQTKAENKANRKARRRYTEWLGASDAAADATLEAIKEMAPGRLQELSKAGVPVGDEETLRLVFGLNKQGYAPAEAFTMGFGPGEYMPEDEGQRWLAAVDMGNPNIESMFGKPHLPNALSAMSEYSDWMTKNLTTGSATFGELSPMAQRGVSETWGGGEWDYRSYMLDRFRKEQEITAQTPFEGGDYVNQGQNYFTIDRTTGQEVEPWAVNDYNASQYMFIPGYYASGYEDWWRGAHPLGFDPTLKTSYLEALEDPYAKGVRKAAAEARNQEIQAVWDPFKERSQTISQFLSNRAGRSPLGMGGRMQTAAQIAQMEKESAEAPGQNLRDAIGGLYDQFLAKSKDLRTSPLDIQYSPEFQQSLRDLITNWKAQERVDYQTYLDSLKQEQIAKARATEAASRDTAAGSW